MMDRRTLLRAASVFAVTALVAPPHTGIARSRGAFTDYPFKLGLASGDPRQDGFVIWTRLAPDPLRGGGMPGEPYLVAWEVAAEETMARQVASGTLLAHPENGHAVHVDVTGLQPDRPYWFRFIAGGEASSIGRTRTFPALGSTKDRLRFAFASCQHFGQGYFNAHRHIANDDLDLVLHLGDYIYESNWGPKVRPHLSEPYTLDEYRNIHALYKTDADLQAAHAACPWAVTWDDHEVDNDYAADLSQDNEDPTEFVKRRAAAYKAYYEHMPLRLSARPRDGRMRLYGTLPFGNLAEFLVLDNRQYRDDQACAGPKFGGQMIAHCAERTDPERSMLGVEQEVWLLEALRSSGATWKVLAQQMLMAQLLQGKPEEDRWWSDGWDGYPAARSRILGEIKDRGIANLVAIGGDIHQHWVTDLKADFDDPGSVTVATEFVGTSITSEGGGWAERYLPQNPHVRFHEWRHRGYVRCEVTPGMWKADMRAVDVTVPAGDARTLASFVVEAGKAGAQRA